ncbi:MAG: methionine--tRNA ligase [Candidatus Omnitrophica bacterium]|nr:methionine--tRNA ligase [Candidatus Omnitrophota bacterium]
MNQLVTDDNENSLSDDDIGHSYTTIAADCLARYHRLAGQATFLLTGTDEHGQKIAQAAAASSKPPQVFADEVSEKFRAAWKLLNISYDDFIRTTQPRHETAVRAVLEKLQSQGKLKRASYKGWYCMPDETFWTETELTAASGFGSAPLCPTCQRPVESTEEEGWYLPLRASQEWLKEFLKSHPQFVRPAGRFNELKSLLESPLPEYLCITRPKNRVSWGIEVPFSSEHVVYVWFDALLNYITVPGFPQDPQRFSSLWPADVHFIGKDILRHHAVYWPIMLHMLGFSDEQMPKTIMAHGHWKLFEQKISKSLGNIIDPYVVIHEVLRGQPYATDIYRYFLLREIPFGQDGNFSDEALLARFNAELANDLGNLVNRTLSMVQRYCEGRLPAVSLRELDAASKTLADSAIALAGQVGEHLKGLEFSLALEAIMETVSKANQFIEVSAPWSAAKAGDQKKVERILGVLGQAIRIISIVSEPFMPSVADAIWKQLGFAQRPRRLQDARQWEEFAEPVLIGKPSILFPRQGEL